MSIIVKIHEQNLTAQTCVVTIKDGVDVVVDYVNIAIVLNEDGTANTIDLNHRIKNQVKMYRDKNSKLLIDTGE